jgi:hypothetical protein
MYWKHLLFFLGLVLLNFHIADCITHGGHELAAAKNQFVSYKLLRR